MSQAINPSPPTLSIRWYSTVEEVHRAMWEQSAIDAGMTYEEMIADSDCCGETESGEVVEFTHEQELDGMRSQGCWGFVDTTDNMIHAWAAPDAEPMRVVHMLAHEVGHITGTPHEDPMQEEMRAEQFGRVAALAYALMEIRE